MHMSICPTNNKTVDGKMVENQNIYNFWAHKLDFNEQDFNIFYADGLLILIQLYFIGWPIQTVQLFSS